jgi:xanthine dehydrogenase YagT iron-sulfur-binding subunit
MNSDTLRKHADSPRRVMTRFWLNGELQETTAAARTTVLDWLRESAGLTGTKKGCYEGACGTCTVLVDGRRMNSCLILLAQVDGAGLTTVEGLAGKDGTLHPVQQGVHRP